jgi:hypothetical protein
MSNHHSLFRLLYALPFSAVLVSSTLLSSSAVAASNDTKAVDLHFPAAPSPDLPYDVNIAALRSLSETPKKAQPPFDIADANIPAAQRLFDIFSWQAFLALNWPANADGTPDKTKTLSDNGPARVWEHFAEVSLVFQPDGAAPQPWDEAVKASLAANRTFWMSGMALGKPTSGSANKAAPDAHFRTPVLDESLQAFTGPMIDQQGKWVRYQAAMNKVEFDYVVENKLYNLEGQVAFTAKNKISFPANKGVTRHGSMEIKTAWKQMSDQDDRSRFFVRNAKVVPLTGEPFEAEFGLVGMHIAVRTESSPTWIWATFEQVDNTSANDLEKDGKGRSLRPTFNNPDNPTKPINQLAPKNSNPVAQYNPATGKSDGPAVFTSWDESLTTDPTQATMVIPVPKATAALNREVQAMLKNLGTVFQYYELIGTQWPTQPAFPAFPNGVAAQADGRLLPAAPESILFKVPGKITPVYLINTTMETFFQNGNQPAGPLAADDRLPPGQIADPSLMFSTESCAGCHFSAGAAIAFKRDANGRYLVQQVNGKNYRVPVYGQNASRGLTGNADFSWLLQLRAQQAPYTGTDIAPLANSLVPPVPSAK